jgi:hypothetical protein
MQLVKFEFGLTMPNCIYDNPGNTRVLQPGWPKSSSVELSVPLDKGPARFRRCGEFALN